MLTGTVAANTRVPPSRSRCDRRPWLRLRGHLLRRVRGHDSGLGQRLHVLLRDPGRIVAWMIGWNLSLEYMISASAVAVSWSEYVANILGDWGIHLPRPLSARLSPRATDSFLETTGSIVNLPAVLIILALGWVCYVGVRESSTANSFMVVIKVAIIVLFILAGIAYVDTSNWLPYVPPNTGKFGEFGWSGVLQGAGIIFFSYIGFDAASTTAREARNPQRDVPLGILGALVISAILYVAMAAVMTGMVPYTKLASTRRSRWRSMPIRSLPGSAGS